MIKIPINTRNFPIFVASLGFILLGMGLGNLGVGSTVNSVWAKIMPLFGQQVTGNLVDTSVSSMYISYGIGIVILSAFVYLVPRILNRR